MSREKQGKVLALLDYIRRICAGQHRVVRDLQQQEWALDLGEAEPDGEFVRFFPGKDEEGREILLEVRRPEFSSCPPLPEVLSDWVETPRWEDCRVDEVKVRPEFSRPSEQMGIIVMRFPDSERRVREFSRWKKARAKWCKEERRKQRVLQLFDDLCRMYELFCRKRETLELMAGNGVFFSGLEDGLHHPLLLKRAQVRCSRDCVQILDAQEEPEFYGELFDGREDMDRFALEAVKRKVTRAGIHPLEKNLGAKLLREAAPMLNAKCRYEEDGLRLLPTDWYILYERPVLFLRRKHPGEDRLLAGIMERVEEKGDVPLPLWDIVDKAPREKEGALPETLADIRGESEDILLVKPANAQQMGIVKKLAKTSAVVVQGPPGTGKTHTIANLLGHFLSKGNRVLVTSASPKALGVLKDKLPEGIRSLCVSLQGDSYRDMEQSLEGICGLLERTTEEELEQGADQLRQRREEALKALRESRQRVTAIRRMEGRKEFFSYEGESYSLSQMARFVHDHERLLEVVPGKVGEGRAIPLTDEELALLYASNGLFSRQDLKEMAENLPKSDRILSPSEAEHLLEEQEILMERERGLLQELPEWFVEEEQVFYRHEQVVREFSKEEFLAAEEDYRQLDFSWMDSAWAREAVLAGRQGGNVRRAWEKMGEDIRLVQERKDAAAVPLMGRSVECPEEFLADEQVLWELDAMGEVFRVKGGMPFLQKLFRRRWRRIFKGILVDGHEMRSETDCDLAARYLALRQARRRVRLEWDQLLTRCGEPSYEEMGLSADDVDDICSARWEQINYCLDWYDRKRESFRKHLEAAGVLMDKILPEDGKFMTPRQQMTMEIRWLQESWPQCAALIRLECMEKRKWAEVFRKRVEELGGWRSQLSKRLAAALQGGQRDAYRRDYEKLLHYESLRDKFRERTDLLARLAAAAPDWAASIACQRGSGGMAEVPSGLEDAWKCRQFLQQLAKVPKEGAEGDEIPLHRRVERLHELTGELVEKLAWGHFFRELSDLGLRGSLMSWSKAVKKVGRDAGKNLSRRARMARKQTMELQAVVPGWIMPLDQAWKTLRPDSRKFDVIIIDEASQANITALPLLYFGHKVILVGDDKQVTPAPLGLSEEELSRIPIPFSGGDPYLSEQSLYDIARVHFSACMLKEHFRSVPEIIGYSNQLVYHNLIQPLRESSGSPLKPVVSYEVEGLRDGEREVNWREAEEIVILMKACMEQPEYKDKSFGAISLLGSEQGRLIREIALRRIGLQPLEKVEFLAGTSHHFQGDERDVVFLSMVDDPDSADRDRGTPWDALERSYNVAVSRARDQLWVIHSVEVGDLPEGDIRRGLLEYAASPETSLTAGGESVEAPLFHREVANALRQRGFHVEEQWLVGSCRIDMAVLSRDLRVAVSCEGEELGEEGRAEERQRKEAVLERLGWAFLHLRGSEFYRAPQKAMDDMEEKLRRYGVLPAGQEASAGKKRADLMARVMETAARIREEWRRDDVWKEEKVEKSLDKASRNG